jgi:hypothetical protein
VFVTPDNDVILIRQAMAGDAVGTGASSFAPPDRVLRDPAWANSRHELMALVDPNNDYVMPLVLVAPSGMYARYSRMWFKVAHPTSAFGDAHLVGVEDSALDPYDDVDTKGMLIHIRRLATKTNWKPHSAA